MKRLSIVMTVSALMVAVVRGASLKEALSTQLESALACNYVCPVGSQRRTTKRCPASFSDCKCKRGFVEKNGGCAPKCYSCPAFSSPTTKCPGGFEDCLCDVNSLRSAATEKCACNYVCPSNSQRITKGCPTSFSDCECKNGYAGRNSECVLACYQCPSFSKSLAYCPKHFEDCQCTKGSTRIGDQQRCVCNFVCPAGSQRTTRGCPKNFSDCKCKDGYKRTSQGCECVAFFRCPLHSRPKATASCYRSLSDCECEEGFWMQSGTCQMKPACNYICPVGSQRTTSGCPTDFTDCKCKEGYERHGDHCECIADFLCPVYSHRKPGRTCYRSFSDCECDDGFWLQGGMCVAKPVCKYICPTNSQRITSGCPADFSDCVCKSGFLPHIDGKCVPDCYDCPDLSWPKTDCPKSAQECECEEGYMMGELEVCEKLPPT